MKVHVTFDYELFFGTHSGSVENCLIRPTKKLIEIANNTDSKFIFFVDVGCILAMEKFEKEYPNLKYEKDLIIDQLKTLNRLGHLLQLHIHPHWEDSFYDGKNWHFIYDRFRLHNFSDNEISILVKKYKEYLETITDKSVFAFRAGGWNLQPFSAISNALKENSVYLDSSVFKGGFSDSNTHRFDYRHCPEPSFWRFETDPLVENTEGYFVELPISSFKYSPFFYWKFAFIKIFKIGGHFPLGDGLPVGSSKKNIIRMLFMPSLGTVSCDGFRAFCLEKAFNIYKKNESHFVVIGHPKASTPYSLKYLEIFLKKHKSVMDIFDDKKD